MIALIPIKQFSERINGKNFMPFANAPLYTYVLRTLHICPSITAIYINTDSDEIINYATSYSNKIQVLKRPEYLCGNDITANTLIDYDLQQIQGEHFFQTHVTNPLIRPDTVERAIAQYYTNLAYSDSLFAATPIRKRAFTNNLHPVNHSNQSLLATQDLPEIVVENSNFFIFSRTSFYQNQKSRIGSTPTAFYMNAYEAMDIDYPDDFKVAELIYNSAYMLDFNVY